MATSRTLRCRVSTPGMSRSRQRWTATTPALPCWHFHVRNPAIGMSSGKSYELWEIRTSRMCKEKYIWSQAAESGLAVGAIFQRRWTVPRT
jgi:hypothetical protein